MGDRGLEQELRQKAEKGKLAVNAATAKFQAPWSIGNEDLRRLSALTPGRGLLHVAFEWGLIFATIFVCQRFWNPLLYVLAVVLIAARQHALLILMHEATHYRLFKNKRLNDVVADLFLAWPTLVGLRGFRCNHLAHHRFLNSERDPDVLRKKDDPQFRFPMKRTDFASLMIKHLFGAGFIYIIRVSRSLSTKNSGETRLYKLARLTFYAASLTTIILLGVFKLFVLYWFVPYATWLMLLLRIRTITEHSTVEWTTNYSKVRTISLSLPERIFMTPKNVFYHIEHHCFPSVPFYRLRELHGLMMKGDFAEAAHETKGYLGVMQQVTSASGLI